MELEILSGSLKEFTRALSCLTKFGDEVDILATPTLLKLSSVNQSRSAFGVFAFDPAFFERYEVTNSSGDSPRMAICVTTKALVAALKPRSAASIESVDILLTEEEPDNAQEPGEESSECRLVIRVHCVHGVMKTHRLAYASASNLYAKAQRGKCTSSWTASSRVLKDWTEHFHLRTSNTSGGTAEISFYHSGTQCRLRSFGEESDNQAGNVDALLSRPLSTELTVDVDDFDQYGVKGNPVINFALKEFKAIITVAENISAPLSAAFSTGGSPFLIALVGDLYTADFVIATHHFDGEPLEDVKREKSEPRRSDTASHGGNAAAAVAGPSNSSHKKAQPLFLPASQEASQRQEDFDEDDEFDALEMGEDDFAEIDRLSQMPPSTASERASSVMHVDGSHKRAKTLDNALIGGHQQQEDNEEHGELDLDAEEQDFDMAGGTTQVGPTPTPISQKLKLKNAAKWNLFPE